MAFMPMTPTMPMPPASPWGQMGRGRPMFMPSLQPGANQMPGARGLVPRPGMPQVGRPGPRNVPFAF